MSLANAILYRLSVCRTKLSCIGCNKMNSVFRSELQILYVAFSFYFNVVIILVGMKFKKGQQVCHALRLGFKPHTFIERYHTLQCNHMFSILKGKLLPTHLLIAF